MRPLWSENSLESGYGLDMEDYFENEMEWIGSGLGMVIWSGDGAKIWLHKDLYS